MGFLFVTFLLLLSPAEARPETTRLCNIELEAAEEIEFSATETKWLCGDEESSAWKSVPPSQQKVFLRSFLQSKGYHQPQFSEAGGKILVRAGEPLTVKSFSVTGAPREWNWRKRWGISGKPLNPETLDESSSWAKRQLQQRGYPCPRVSPLAFTDTGEIRLDLEPGPFLDIGAIESGQLTDLDPAILERFTAFRPGQLFDIRLLELTSSRILAEDLYLSTYYDVICDENQRSRIVRRFVPAQPRLFTVGAGFDTDRGPLARARMKWARLGRAADSVELSLFASLREQSLTSRYHYHFLNDLSSRLKLVPMVSVLREAREEFISVTSQVGTSLANSWEARKFQLAAEAGPLLERVNIHRGEGPKRVDNLKLTSRLTAQSHLFEYYLSDPREGWLASLETTSQFGGVLSEQSVHRLTFQHQLLWNIGGWDPAFFILGWRGTAGSFFFGQRSALPPDIAVSQKYFLGGDENIRGFETKGLPGDQRGFFAMLYQGLELRTGKWFPLAQPFVFFDFAKGGDNPRRLNRTNYYASGFGLRYDSPVGTIRATLGRGFMSERREIDPLPAWHAFFSFGKEF